VGTWLPVLVAVAALCGCSGTVSTVSTGSTGAGGSGSSSSHCSSSGTAGGSASSSSHASSSGTGGQGCGGAIDLAVDNGAPVHWASICFGSWGSGSTTSAVGYFFSGGPAPGIQALDVEGCENSGDAVVSPGIRLSAPNAMTPGTYTMGSATYTDSMGVSWGAPGDAFKMTVTAIGPVAGHIDGSFSGFVSHGGNAVHSLDGSFHVCRVQDELAP
jgi:hypothetical protein